MGSSQHFATSFDGRIPRFLAAVIEKEWAVCDELRGYFFNLVIPISEP